ncbi:MAG: hypothetical protein ACOY6N_10410 [Pseudomonadota bacterium]
MSQVTMNDCPASTESESGMKKTGKIICGSCILLAMGIPIALVIIALAAKLLGYY